MGLTVLLSSQEETGGLGALTASFAIAPTQAIAVDVTFGSTPEIADHHVPLVGKGPAVGTGSILSRKMAREIMAAAQEEGIGYQVEVLSGRGTGTNCVSIPLRYMHTPIEVIDPKDVENTARLLAAYAKKLGR